MYEAQRGLRVHEHLGHVLTAVSLPRKERDRVRQFLVRQGKACRPSPGWRANESARLRPARSRSASPCNATCCRLVGPSSLSFVIRLAAGCVPNPASCRSRFQRSHGPFKSGPRDGGTTRKTRDPHGVSCDAKSTNDVFSGLVLATPGTEKHVPVRGALASIALGCTSRRREGSKGVKPQPPIVF